MTMLRNLSFALFVYALLAAVALLTPMAADAQAGALSLTAYLSIMGPSARSTSDQPDDSSDYQVHVMYVLPSDGIDRQYDTNGAIARSVSSWEYWLRGQTNGKGLKMDTHNGQLDVTFVRLNATDNTISTGADLPYTVNAQSNAFVRDDIEWHLRQMGLIDPKKLYAVYYGGSSNFSCGGGAWPPTLPGQVAALYKVDGNDCVTDKLGLSGTTPGFADISMLHEIMHTLGFVPTTAPHHTRAGHVSDSPTDLMYAGDQAWTAPNVVLDYNHDDYYLANISNSLDLSNSIFFQGGGTQLPPNWGQSSITVSTPAPTATLTANDTTTGVSGTNLTVSVGDSLDYTWSSANGSTYSSTYKGDLSYCGTGPWAANTASGSSAGNIVASGSAGCTYTTTYTVTASDGTTAAATITLKVNAASISTTAPTATLSAYDSSTQVAVYNNTTTLTVSAGDWVGYDATNSNCASVATTLTDNGTPGMWSSGFTGCSVLHVAPVQVGSALAGHTYVLTYTVTASDGTTANASVTTSVKAATSAASDLYANLASVLTALSALLEKMKGGGSVIQR